jgi:hypothetical protein
MGYHAVMTEVAEVVSDSIEHPAEGRFNSLIALAVAVTATFTALCNVKDGNVVQAMAQDQAGAVDQWAYYQAKGTKENIAEAALDQMVLDGDLRADLSTAARTHLNALIADYRTRIKTYEQEKQQIKAKAEELQRDYDRLNIHDDQFDLAEALMSVAIALFGITALTRKRLLLVFAGALAALGMLFGLSGFFQWSIHPDFLTRLLS